MKLSDGIIEYDFDKLELVNLQTPILNEAPPPFNFETEGVIAKEFAAGLSAKMIKLSGVGLSANQIGIPRRVFTFGNVEKQLTLFNPYILGVSKNLSTMEEGCLSIPGLVLVLKRPEKVMVNFFDENGEEKTGTFDGPAARIVQHEMDHMEGRNFTMHASPMKLEMAVKKWRNKQKKEYHRLFAEARKKFMNQRTPNLTPVEANG